MHFAAGFCYWVCGNPLLQFWMSLVLVFLLQCEQQWTTSTTLIEGRLEWMLPPNMQVIIQKCEIRSVRLMRKSKPFPKMLFEIQLN